MQLLPHELELYIAQYITLAKELYVIMPESMSKIEKQYFSFWTPLEDLITRSGRLAGLPCFTLLSRAWRLIDISEEFDQFYVLHCSSY